MNVNTQNKIAKILTEAKNGNEKKVNDIFNSFINKKITMENLEICGVLLASKDIKKDIKLKILANEDIQEMMNISSENSAISFFTKAIFQAIDISPEIKEELRNFAARMNIENWYVNKNYQMITDFPLQERMLNNYYAMLELGKINKTTKFWVRPFSYYDYNDCILKWNDRLKEVGEVPINEENFEGCDETVKNQLMLNNTVDDKIKKKIYLSGIDIPYLMRAITEGTENKESIIFPKDVKNNIFQICMDTIFSGSEDDLDKITSEQEKKIIKSAIDLVYEFVKPEDTAYEWDIYQRINKTLPFCTGISAFANLYRVSLEDLKTHLLNTAGENFLVAAFADGKLTKEEQLSIISNNKNTTIIKMRKEIIAREYVEKLRSQYATTGEIETNAKQLLAGICTNFSIKISDETLKIMLLIPHLREEVCFCLSNPLQETEKTEEIFLKKCENADYRKSQECKELSILFWLRSKLNKETFSKSAKEDFYIKSTILNNYINQSTFYSSYNSYNSLYIKDKSVCKKIEKFRQNIITKNPYTAIEKDEYFKKIKLEPNVDTLGAFYSLNACLQGAVNDFYAFNTISEMVSFKEYEDEKTEKIFKDYIVDISKYKEINPEILKERIKEIPEENKEKILERIIKICKNSANIALAGNLSPKETGELCVMVKENIKEGIEQSIQNSLREIRKVKIAEKEEER